MCWPTSKQGLKSTQPWRPTWRSATAQHRPASRPWPLPTLAAFGGLNAYLWQRISKDRIPVLTDSTVRLAMSLTALDSTSARTTADVTLFLSSDALLALEKFGGLHLPATRAL